MAYEPYNWTTSSYLNPTRMNAIEQGIAAASQTAESAGSNISTIEAAIGTQSIAGIGDGTLTGATWKINNDLTTLNSKLPLSFTPAEGVTVTNFEGFVKNGIAYAWIRINSGANSTTMGTFSVKSLGSTKYYYQGGSNVTAQQGASIRVINGDLQALIGTGTSYSPFKGDLWAFVTYPIN